MNVPADRFEDESALYFALVDEEGRRSPGPGAVDVPMVRSPASEAAAGGRA
jgi:hypothetical protein